MRQQTAALGLRAKITLAVTAIFGLGLSAGAMATVWTTERRLTSSAEEAAAAIVHSHFESGLFPGGDLRPTEIERQNTTTFFYLDEKGQEIPWDEYAARVLKTLMVTQPSAVLMLGDDPTRTQRTLSADELASLLEQPAPPPPRILVHAPAPYLIYDVGAVELVDRGPESISVGSTVQLDGESSITVGVSTPKSPINEATSTVRLLLLGAVPLLTAVVGAITWAATGRVLAPIDQMIMRAEQISAANLDDRLPASGRGDEIGKLANSLNRMLARIDQAQRTQRRFVADASHELRSPVAAAIAQLEVAQTNPTDADWAQVSSTVLGEQRYLASLVADLITLSRMDELADTSPTMGLVDLDEIVYAAGATSPAGAIDRAAAQPDDTAVEVTVGDAVRIAGDAALVQRAVRNLTDNALRHARSRVAISLTRSGDWATITVDDDGAGIPEDHRDAIFERFYRTDEARARSKGGSGLGLAITKRVAESHGGCVEVTDSPLGGARFVIRIPITPTG